MSSRFLLFSETALTVGAMSAVLLAGCARRELPTPQETAATGVRFTSIQGRVQVKKAGTLAWIDATLALTLQRDDLVKTDRNATAKLRFADGTQFDVRNDSMITVFENSNDLVSGQPHVGVGIQSGEANFRTPPQAGKRRIRTPAGSAAPGGGTEGNVRVAADGKTGVRVFEGEGQVESRAGQQIHLGPREGVQIDAEGKAGAKLSLPEVPTLAAPPNQFEVYIPDPTQATTRLAWNGVAGAGSYRVVVDAGGASAGPSIDRWVDQGTELALRGLEAGAYCWRVAAVDASGTEGGFSSAWCFSLLKAQSGVPKPPQLALDVIELKGTQLHVTGRTEAGVIVTINGVGIPVQRDGSFSEHVVLERNATTVSIRATGVSGAVTEQQLPIVITR